MSDHDCTGDDTTCGICEARVERAKDRRRGRHPDENYDTGRGWAWPIGKAY